MYSSLLQCHSLSSATQAMWILSDATLCLQQVRAVYYNDTPIADMPMYLFEGHIWNARRVENLTTNSDGIATFSFSTANRHDDIKLHVSKRWHYNHNL